MLKVLISSLSQKNVVTDQHLKLYKTRQSRNLQDRKLLPA
jgi:hypothetical protein